MFKAEGNYSQIQLQEATKRKQSGYVAKSKQTLPIKHNKMLGIQKIKVKYMVMILLGHPNNLILSNHLFKGPVSKCNHILRDQGWDFNKWILGTQSSPLTEA